MSFSIRRASVSNACARAGKSAPSHSSDSTIVGAASDQFEHRRGQLDARQALAQQRDEAEAGHRWAWRARCRSRWAGSHRGSSGRDGSISVKPRTAARRAVSHPASCGEQAMAGEDQCLGMFDARHQFDAGIETRRRFEEDLRIGPVTEQRVPSRRAARGRSDGRAPWPAIAAVLRRFGSRCLRSDRGTGRWRRGCRRGNASSAATKLS